MTTRRELLLVSLGLAADIPLLAFFSGEFWNEKPATEWSEKEIQRLLTKSPWAKEANAEMNFANMPPPGGAAPGGGRAGGPGGPGGGPPMGGPGMGGPGMDGGPGGPGAPSGGLRIKAQVRWESAAPMREATKRQFPRDPAGCYVIGVSGLVPRGADESQRRRANDQGFPNGFRENTVLERKGKDSLAPVHIEMVSDGGLLFYFPIDANPISLDDKEVVFRSKLGPLEVKAKFIMKEMRYRGDLAL